MTLPMDAGILAGIRLFEGIPHSQAQRILATGRLMRATGVSSLFQQDQPANDVYLVVESCARYFVLTEDGRKIFLTWLGPGAFLGASALLGVDSTYLAGVEVDKGTAVVRWTRDHFKELAKTTPALVSNAQVAAFEIVASYLQQHLATVADNASQKLAKTLLTIAAAVGTKGVAGTYLSINNEQLANTANVTLFTVSRHISRWVRNDILGREPGNIIVRDPHRLAEQL
jgi:CRP-like cAMP-binding protein